MKATHRHTPVNAITVSCPFLHCFFVAACQRVPSPHLARLLEHSHPFALWRYISYFARTPRHSLRDGGSPDDSFSLCWYAPIHYTHEDAQFRVTNTFRCTRLHCWVHPCSLMYSCLFFEPHMSDNKATPCLLDLQQPIPVVLLPVFLSFVWARQIQEALRRHNVRVRPGESPPGSIPPFPPLSLSLSLPPSTILRRFASSVRRGPPQLLVLTRGASLVYHLFAQDCESI